MGTVTYYCFEYQFLYFLFPSETGTAQSVMKEADIAEKVFNGI